MKVIKPYLKSALFIFSCLLIGSLITTIFYYFNFMSAFIYRIFNLGIIFITFFLGGIHIGYKAKEKGYLEGIKLAIPFIIFFAIISLVFKEPLSVISVLYYLIILFITTLGSVIGINRKEKK